MLLIVPHAGYDYSGLVAAAGYNCIKNIRPDLIVILAPSHYGSFHGCSVIPVDFYETPLGRVRVEKNIAQMLLEEKLFVSDGLADRSEHAVEIQIPFLQRIFGRALERDIPILPILVGDISRTEAGTIADIIIRNTKNSKRPLFIISSDFIHYGPRFDFAPYGDLTRAGAKEKLKMLDDGAISRIISEDAAGFADYVEATGATICGRDAILIALHLPVKSFKASVIRYDTSGRITGDYSNSVSYAAIAVSGILRSAEPVSGSNGMDFPSADKSFLLKLARNNITSYISSGHATVFDEKAVPPSCRQSRGAFVTLKKKGELRGCIGYINTDKPLYQVIQESSYNAAFGDPRFPPLRSDELADITIEISVLTVPALVSSCDDVTVGKDGIIIEKGLNRGLLLPQVPLEWGWGREQFLIYGCRKAGLPDYSWKKGAKIYTFQAVVFGEGEKK